MTWLILGLVAVGLAISAPLTVVARSVGRRVGALDTPGAPGHAKVLRAVPNNGGIAIYLAVAVPIATGLIAVWGLDAQWWSVRLPALADHLARIRQSTPTAIAMLAAMTALYAIGAVDDRRSVGPVPKLAVQFAAAATPYADLARGTFSSYRSSFCSPPVMIMSATSVWGPMTSPSIRLRITGGCCFS